MRNFKGLCLLVALLILVGVSFYLSSPSYAATPQQNCTSTPCALLLSAASMPVHRQASLAPAASFNNSAYLEWDGGTLGVNSTFFLDNPGLVDGGEWTRSVQLVSQDRNRFAEFGLDKCNDNLTCLCPTFGRSALYVFTWSDQDPGPICFEMAQNNDNINKQCSFQITENSTGNGVEYIMSCSYDNSNHPCSGGGCSEYFTLPAWYRIQLGEYIHNTFSGHDVYGGTWTQNQYQNVKTKAWVYQSRNSDTLVATNPPQMYWHQVPAPGNNGGTLYSCVYSSGTTCNYRSNRSSRKD